MIEIKLVFSLWEFEKIRGWPFFFSIAFQNIPHALPSCSTVLFQSNPSWPHKLKLARRLNKDRRITPRNFNYEVCLDSEAKSPTFGQFSNFFPIWDFLLKGIHFASYTWICYIIWEYVKSLHKKNRGDSCSSVCFTVVKVSNFPWTAQRASDLGALGIFPRKGFFFFFFSTK